MEQYDWLDKSSSQTDYAKLGRPLASRTASTPTNSFAVLLKDCNGTECDPQSSSCIVSTNPADFQSLEDWRQNANIKLGKSCVPLWAEIKI